MTTYLPQNVIERVGNLFDTDLAIGHGVNVDGVMGAGVAKIVRTKYPSVFKEYAEACAAGTLHTGDILPVQAQEDGRWILNLASQDRPGPHARKGWLSNSLLEAFEWARENGVVGFAIPRIGSNIGGLEWEDVFPLVNRVAEFYPDIKLEVWSLPDADSKPVGNQTEQLIEALKTFNKYGAGNKVRVGGKGKLHVGVNPTDVEVKDLSRLRILGWKVNRHDDGFVKTF